MFTLYDLLYFISSVFVTKKRHLPNSAPPHFEINNIITYRKTIFDGPIPHSWLAI